MVSKGPEYPIRESLSKAHFPFGRGEEFGAQTILANALLTKN